MDFYVKEQVNSENAPKAVGPYSQAVKAGPFLFASGMLPIIPETGKFPEGGVEEQAKQIFRNMQAVLSEAGTDISKIVKTTVFLKNISDFAAVNRLYAEAFDGAVFPARSAFEVANLPLGALVEIEYIAIL